MKSPRSYRRVLRLAFSALAAVVALLVGGKSAFASMPAGFCDERGATMIAELPALPVGSESIDADPLPCDDAKAGALSATTLDGSHPAAPAASDALVDLGIRLPSLAVQLFVVQPEVLSFMPPSLAPASGHELGCDRPPIAELSMGPRPHRARVLNAAAPGPPRLDSDRRSRSSPVRRPALQAPPRVSRGDFSNTRLSGLALRRRAFRATRGRERRASAVFLISQRIRLR